MESGGSFPPSVNVFFSTLVSCVYALMSNGEFCGVLAHVYFKTAVGVSLHLDTLLQIKCVYSTRACEVHVRTREAFPTRFPLRLQLSVHEERNRPVKSKG